MKKTILILNLFMFSLLSSCSEHYTLSNNTGGSHQSTSHQPIKGNKNIKTEERNLDAFSLIDISGEYNIYYSQSEKQSIRIQTDENILEYIETRVSGEKLFINNTKNTSIRPSTIDIYLSSKDISGIYSSGSVNVALTTPIETKKDITLAASGSATIKGNMISADRIIIKMSGASAIFSEIACNDLQVSISGSSQIKLNGKVVDSKLSSSGSSNIDIKSLSVENTVYINTSGASNVILKNGTSAKISTSGSSNISFEK